jgi:hypothetical protein
MYREIKSFFQRGWRGYADSDIWSFDWYLRIVLSNGLKKFRKDPTGYPGHGEANTPKKWKKILKEMESGFRAVLEEDEKTGFGPKMNAAYKKEDKSLKLLSKWFGSLWD